MRVAVVLEARFSRAHDGTIWSGAAFPHSFWSRYLDVFDEVHVVARCRDAEPQSGEVRSDGPGVTFAPVPYYVGPAQYLLRWRAARGAVLAAIRSPAAVIMRVASPLGSVAWKALVRRRQPYGLELVGDPWDVFAPGGIRHPLRPFLRHYLSRQLRCQCAKAAACAYVTGETLQRRYPLEGGYTTSYSSISLHLPDGPLPCVRQSPARVTGSPSGAATWRAVFVGSLEQLYKGPDILLRALAVCRRRGVPVVLTVIGGGRCLAGLQTLARHLGVDDAVEFKGTLPAGDPVYRVVVQSDLFILPSRTEGLPRALIEAMALGVPAIGTRVGGIPELLAIEDLVPSDNVEALAQRMEAVLGDVRRRRSMQARNRTRAELYSEANLAPRRRAFYEYVRAATETWLRSTGGSAR